MDNEAKKRHPANVVIADVLADVVQAMVIRMARAAPHQLRATVWDRQDVPEAAGLGEMEVVVLARVQPRGKDSRAANCLECAFGEPVDQDGHRQRCTSCGQRLPDRTVVGGQLRVAKAEPEAVDHG